MSEQSSPRVAVITGAGGGLGQAFALRLASTGCGIVLTDRQPCTELVARLTAAGTNVIDMVCELGNADAVRRFARGLLERVGRVDILVNNAAFIPHAPIAAITPALLGEVMAVNVGAPLLLAQAIAPGMRSRGWGRIVNLASSTVWGPPPGMGAYVTSKMALIGLTRALAAELGEDGITVNAISPGLTRHPGSAAALPPEAFDAVRQRQFIPRTELPDDLTGALAFLVSDEAAFITGQVLNVDGGGFGF